MHVGAHDPGADDPMSTPRPDKTIDELFAEFLAAQKARLSPQIHSRYEGIIERYRGYLERYWPDHSGRDYDAVTGAGGTYCGSYGADDITEVARTGKGWRLGEVCNISP
jgi:hypothetical protein